MTASMMVFRNWLKAQQKINWQMIIMIPILFFKKMHLKAFHNTEICSKKFPKFRIILMLNNRSKKKDFNLINRL